MNGKRAKALRKVALDTACEMLPQTDGAIPDVRYVDQPRKRVLLRIVNQRRLGPCIRKVEKETKREFNSLTR